ncbi:MAG: hypothetical protein J1E65_05795 [Lachnospiraceae bacterium]|nr:hypothetical protein [Lachnospiraceae bacterium]
MAVLKSNVKKNTGKAITIKGGVVILLMVVAMVGYYYYLSNKDKQIKAEQVDMSVAQELISRNLSTNYPPTPKEVVRYYSDITRCFYNEEYTEEEFKQLVNKAYELYDRDLQVQNEYGQYLIELSKDIEYYKDNSIRIANYSVSASTDVDIFQDSGYDFARLYCTYTLVRGARRQPVEEVYLLRKDEDGHWRIYGWDLAENVNIEEPEE